MSTLNCVFPKKYSHGANSHSDNKPTNLSFAKSNAINWHRIQTDFDRFVCESPSPSSSTSTSAISGAGL